MTSNLSLLTRKINCCIQQRALLSRLTLQAMAWQKRGWSITDPVCFLTLLYRNVSLDFFFSSHQSLLKSYSDSGVNWLCVPGLFPSNDSSQPSRKPVISKKSSSLQRNAQAPYFPEAKNCWCRRVFRQGGPWPRGIWKQSGEGS